MTSLIETRLASAVRRAAVRATLAPSVHNTQPWRFWLSASALEIHADWTRRLRVLDPRGRQLLISCGCALFNARVALGAAGYDPTVNLFPDPTQPNLVARLAVAEPVSDGLAIGALDSVIEQRHTNRRRFTEESVSPEVVNSLAGIALEEGAELFPIIRAEHRLAIARLSREVDDLQSLDAAYRAELRAWTSEDSHRLDGVAASAGPPTETHSSMDQCLLMLGTAQDQPADWVRAGEALERVLLEITRRGFAASPFPQIIEVAAANALLRQELQLTMYPHVLLRVGRAAATPASRRRRLVDMLEESW